MTDIVVEGGNDFKMIKVEVGDDNEWKAAYGIDIVPDFGVFVNNQYYHFNGKKEAGFIFLKLLMNRDLLHFVVNRTDDSILKVANKEQIEFIQEKGNALMIGLFNEGVLILKINLFNRVMKNLFLRKMYSVIVIVSLFFLLLKFVILF